MDLDITYRNPTEDDLEAVTEVINRSTRELKQHTDIQASETRAMTFGDEDFVPSGYLVGIGDGEVIAFGGTTVNRARTACGYSDASLVMHVIPEHRGKGLEDRLMSHAFEYLRSGGVAAARIFSYIHGDWRGSLALRFGMVDIRHGYLMRFDDERDPSEPVMPNGYSLSWKLMDDMSDVDIEQFVEVFNDSFADHWNFYKHSAHMFLKLRTEAPARESVYRSALAMRDGEAVGFTWAEISEKYNRQHGIKAGFVNILGVKKPHRRNGIGRALLSDAMLWIRGLGMDVVFLSMEAQNSKALALYQSQGFRVDEESVTYELML